MTTNLYFFNVDTDNGLYSEQELYEFLSIYLSKLSKIKLRFFKTHQHLMECKKRKNHHKDFAWTSDHLLKQHSFMVLFKLWKGIKCLEPLKV